ALTRLKPGVVRVAAGNGAATPRPRVADGPLADRLAAALPAFGDPPDEPGGVVRRPLLDVVEETAGQFRQQAVIVDEPVELVTVEYQQADGVVAELVLVKDVNAHDVADDISGPIMVAADPDQAEVVTVGVAADQLQAGEVAFGEPLEVQVVEDIA